MGGDKRQWEAMHHIREDIDQISRDLDYGRFDPREIRARIQRADYDLQRVQSELDYKNKRRGGYYRSY